MDVVRQDRFLQLIVGQFGAAITSRGAMVVRVVTWINELVKGIPYPSA
jgi:hypothetical protein